MEIIYIDSLFFLNALIDYLLLLVSVRICCLPINRLRLALSAALGGAYAAAAALLPGIFALAAVKLLAGAALVCIAVGLSKKTLRALCAFFAVSAAFGGAVYFLSRLGGAPAGGTRAFVRVSVPVLLVSFAMCYAAVSLVFRRCGRRAERELAEITLRCGGRSCVVPALLDSGNELIDPVSGLPVLIAEAGALAPLFGAGTSALLGADPVDALGALSSLPGTPRLRLLPCRSIAPGECILLCFTPDKAECRGRGLAVCAAVSRQTLSPDGEYRAVLSPGAL